MGRILAALSLCVALIAGAVPAMAQTVVPRTCSQAISLTQVSTGTTGLIGPNATIPASMAAAGPAATNLASGNGIQICGYVINMAAAGTAGLEYGTKASAACDTGTVPLTPAWSLPVNGTIADNADYFRGLAVPPGNTLCLVSTTSPASIIVYYNNLVP